MAQLQCPKCDARFRGDIKVCPIDGQTLVTPSDPFLGTVIAGRYLVEELLGVGGMGSVYRARHQFIGRDVALKFLDPSLTKNERLRKRFLGEARAANQINHEHIIDITDFGETENGVVYMVMEYLEGHSLEEELEKGPIEPRRAVRIALQVALGLGRAHELGVVHRDIKPGNIHLSRKRMDRDFVKVLDFGVARIEHDARITGQNMIVGTPEYIAPEQIRSAIPTPSSDLYALGCVMFEMLSGRIPFEGKTTQLLVKHINEPPVAPSSLNPQVPLELDRVVLRLMQKKPEQRHRDAYHLVEDLQRLLDMLPGVTSSRPNVVTRPSRSSPPAVDVQPEEDGWARTAALYRQLLLEVGAEASTAPWLNEAIAEIETAIGETRDLRKQLEETAAKATLQQEDVRKPREQIGHALDELSKDDSRIGGQIAEIIELLEPGEQRLDAAMHAVLSGLSVVPRMLRAGEPVSERDAAALAELVRAGSELSLSRDMASELRARLTRKKAERRDLRFQMVQLKQKLDQLNQSRTVDMEIWHEDAHKLSAAIQHKLESIAPTARRISSHLQRFPGVRDRLGSGHAPITLS